MTVGNLSYEDVVAEVLDGEYNIINLDKKPTEDFTKLIKDGFDECLPLNSIDLSNKLQLDYYKENGVIDKVQRYIKNRRLLNAINRPKSFYISLKDKTHKNRLIIPFYDINGKIIFYQSRAIGANLDDFMEDVKYLSKKNSLKSVFNIDKIDDNQEEIFIFEGPIDACFIKNGVAVGGITPSREKSLTDIQEEQLGFYRVGHTFIWVLDSQWIDEAAREKTEILLKNGENVFIWPENIGKNFKDFNELCVAAQKDGIPKEYVVNNTVSGQSRAIKI